MLLRYLRAGGITWPLQASTKSHSKAVPKRPKNWRAPGGVPPSALILTSAGL